MRSGLFPELVNVCDCKHKLQIYNSLFAAELSIETLLVVNDITGGGGTILKSHHHPWAEVASGGGGVGGAMVVLGNYTRCAPPTIRRNIL